MTLLFNEGHVKVMQSFLELKDQYVNRRIVKNHYICVLEIPLDIQRDIEDFISYNPWH